MKVFIIPDVHLKPCMWTQAKKIVNKLNPDRIIFLGDLVDDFGCTNNPKLYQETLAQALTFVSQYPDTLWCYGNHDIAYFLNMAIPGTASHSSFQTVKEGLEKLYHTIPNGHLKYVHQIDHVLFSHAGISRMFVKDHFNETDYKHVERVVQAINQMKMDDMWYDESPLWLRPQKQYRKMLIRMYAPRKYLQVVGHSPMKTIAQENNLLSCDTFSTYSNGLPYGSQEFCLLDTLSFKWQAISGK